MALLRVVNGTALDTAVLEWMVEAVQPSGLQGDVLVEFLPGTLSRGFAYPERRGVRVWLDGDSSYPVGIDRPRRRRAGPQPSGIIRLLLWSLEEVALFLTAHELLHLWQAEHGRLIAPGVRYLDERDANAYAARALRRWRAAGY